MNDINEDAHPKIIIPAFLFMDGALLINEYNNSARFIFDLFEVIYFVKQHVISVPSFPRY